MPENDIEVSHEDLPPKYEEEPTVDVPPPLFAVAAPDSLNTEDAPPAYSEDSADVIEESTLPPSYDEAILPEKTVSFPDEEVPPPAYNTEPQLLTPLSSENSWYVDLAMEVAEQSLVTLINNQSNNRIEPHKFMNTVQDVVKLNEDSSADEILTASIAVLEVLAMALPPVTEAVAFESALTLVLNVMKQLSNVAETQDKQLSSKDDNKKSIFETIVAMFTNLIKAVFGNEKEMTSALKSAETIFESVENTSEDYFRPVNG